jgi:hypothetical protein
MSEIKFLKKQDVRKVWQKEDADFTPWMAQIEPLTHLLQECGIDVGELDEETEIQKEVLIPGVGRRLDILVTLGDGTRVAIENQFNALDHDHLTRSLAYAVGLEVSTVIVVAEYHKPEFVNVAEYLNSAAAAYDHGIKFFLVQVEVLSAEGSSNFYPNFKLIEGPDEWRGAIEEIQTGNPKAETSALIYNYHETALPILRETTGVYQNVNASKNFWKASGLGLRGLQISVIAAREYTTIQIWMHRSNSPEFNKTIFNVFDSHRAEIEKELSPCALEWKIQNAGIIETVIQGFGYRTENSEKDFRNMAEIAGKMSRCAQRYIPEIKEALSKYVSEAEFSRA